MRRRRVESDQEAIARRQSELMGPIAAHRLSAQAGGDSAWPDRPVARRDSLALSVRSALEQNDSRSQRLFELKSAIADGTYPRDSGRVATALLHYELA